MSSIQQSHDQYLQLISHPIMHHVLLHLLSMHGIRSLLLLGSFSVTAHYVLDPCLGVLLQTGTVLLSNLRWVLGRGSILRHVSLRHFMSQIQETLLVKPVVPLSNIPLYVWHLTPICLSRSHQDLLLLLLLGCHLWAALVKLLLLLIRLPLLDLTSLLLHHLHLCKLGAHKLGLISLLAVLRNVLHIGLLLLLDLGLLSLLSLLSLLGLQHLLLLMRLDILGSMRISLQLSKLLWS